MAPKKAICVSRSFGTMLEEKPPVREAVASFTASVAQKLRAQHCCATALTVFIETNPFRLDLPQRFPSRTVKLPTATALAPELLQTALRMLDGMWKPGYAYKKAGVLVTGIIPESEVQGSLFCAQGPEHRARLARLAGVADKINRAQGRDTVRHAAEGFQRTCWMRQMRLSPRYTTRWAELAVAG